MTTELEKSEINSSVSIAHVRLDEQGEWHIHPLVDHLQDVAAMAGGFAQSFGAEDWASLAGLWHDLGKYRLRFQRYIGKVSGYNPNAHIQGESGKAPHSTAGAILACEKLGNAGRILAYLIAGHHAGLYDWNSENSSLQYRLDGEDAHKELAESKKSNPPAAILDAANAFKPDLRKVPGGKDGFALWIRMLFSCLVDADFLDTEKFMDESKFTSRGNYPANSDLLKLFNNYMEDMAKSLAEKGPLTPVNRLRSDILSQCRKKSEEPPGLFSLTVPTGGGKTLSSLAFALQHAFLHNKRRIIYVIPYTSIIEQTADIFRNIFGAETVIEHHSNAEMEPSEENSKSRLACENWDAPIIVTTNVQFFESLFASRTSRCRKLHNIVDSVVILDEAQMLPPDFLQPILDVLNLLARHYGVSVVLSTATQPALSTREYFDPQQNLRGLDNVREMMKDGPHIYEPGELYKALKRVNVTLPGDWYIPVSWKTLAEELQAHNSVLCVVNRRKDARELFKLMPKGTLHLSALMCGAHRSDIIYAIKQRLKKGQPTRVISTQLVEAGVDLDFPVVYRALAGLDSIAQAAGRCNREGLLERGKVVVFIPPKPAPPGLLKKAEDASRSVLHGITADPLDRNLFARYFEQFYYACSLDEYGIGKLLEVDGQSLAINFRTAAEKFRLIKDEGDCPVIVRYHGLDGNKEVLEGLLGKFRKDGPARWLMRKLQRYTVTVKRQEAQRWLKSGDAQELQPGLYVQTCDFGYSDELGLTLYDDVTLNSIVLQA